MSRFLNCLMGKILTIHQIIINTFEIDTVRSLVCPIRFPHQWLQYVSIIAFNSIRLEQTGLWRI